MLNDEVLSPGIAETAFGNVCSWKDLFILKALSPDDDQIIGRYFPIPMGWVCEGAAYSRPRSLALHCMRPLSDVKWVTTSGVYLYIIVTQTWGVVVKLSISVFPGSLELFYVVIDPYWVRQNKNRTMTRLSYVSSGLSQQPSQQPLRIAVVTVWSSVWFSVWA